MAFIGTQHQHQILQQSLPQLGFQYWPQPTGTCWQLACWTLTPWQGCQARLGFSILASPETMFVPCGAPENAAPLVKISQG